MFAAENGLKGDPRLEAISAAIRVVPDFPKKGLQNLFLPLCRFTTHLMFVLAWSLFLILIFSCFFRTGIMFQDITTLLLDHKAFKHTVDIFVDRYKDMQISVVAGKPPHLFLSFFPQLFRHQILA